MYKKYDLTKILKDGKVKDVETGDIFELSHFTVSSNDIWAMIDGIFPGEYIRLTQNGKIVISNTDMEKDTSKKIINKAHGDVLIGGLGIGMITLEIQDKENVRSITVLEKHQAVIDLVKNQLPLNSKVNIIKEDVFTYNTAKKYDCVYMDIWNFIDVDIYENEIIPLKRKYKHYLKDLKDSPKRFNKCWSENQARNIQKLV